MSFLFPQKPLRKPDLPDDPPNDVIQERALKKRRGSASALLRKALVDSVGAGQPKVFEVTKPSYGSPVYSELVMQESSSGYGSRDDVGLELVKLAVGSILHVSTADVDVNQEGAADLVSQLATDKSPIYGPDPYPYRPVFTTPYGRQIHQFDNVLDEEVVVGVMKSAVLPINLDVLKLGSDGFLQSSIVRHVMGAAIIAEVMSSQHTLLAQEVSNLTEKSGKLELEHNSLKLDNQSINKDHEVVLAVKDTVISRMEALVVDRS